jgi:cytochrome c peroxidase
MAAASAISVGDRLPEATLLAKGPDGLARVSLSEKTVGRRVVIVAVPGAFTPTCDGRHLPSFVRTKPQFDAKGIDEVICVSVNDVHVMALWGETSGATEAGITMLADGDASFTKAMGMNYDRPEVGFFDRSRRYALYAEDGVVKVLNVEETPGACEISAGETLLDQI